MSLTTAPSRRSSRRRSAPCPCPPPAGCRDARARMMKLSDQDALLLNAYLDGELAALEAVDFERRLAGEPGLSAELGTYRAMRAALRADRSDDVPSADLGRRI